MYKTLYNYRHIWELKVAVRRFTTAYHGMCNSSVLSYDYEHYLSDALNAAHEFSVVVNTITTLSTHYHLDISYAELCDLMDIGDRMLHLALYYGC